MEVSEIIERVDILSYISQFCELEERQDGEYWGLSPLKEENTPSFSVNVDKQRFYDFSSGKGGNVLDFIRQYHQCEFMEGLQILKKYANIRDDDPSTSSQRLLATSVAKKFKRHQKREKENKSTILPADYMNRYERNKDKLSVWRDEGITPESMERFSVRYDPFSDRIVYPIRNMQGDIINVCGRTLDPNYKANKQRKYTYFKPLGILDTIYGFAENKEEILKKREIILFEGAKSVMIADGWGIKNTGAILTSHLNPYQFKLLIRLGITVVFALDAEVDIREDVNIKKLLPYVRVEWVRNRNGLLEDKDAPVDKGYIYDTDQKYDLIVADPPWKQSKGGKKSVRKNSSGEPLDYPVCTLEEIKEHLAKVNEHTEDNAVLFLWTIDKYLFEAEQIARDLGYKLHARMVWNKVTGIPAAFTIRFGHEYLLYMYKGKLLPVDKDERGKIHSVFTEQVKRHSQKPEVSFEIINRLYPNAKKIELYARTERNGFDCWGNEVAGYEVRHEETDCAC